MKNLIMVIGSVIFIGYTNFALAATHPALDNLAGIQASETEPIESSDSVSVNSTFFPLGFSKNGRFAYIYIQDIDGFCGCYFGGFRVVNLINDSIERETFNELHVKSRKEALDQLLSVRGAEFLAIIEEFGISSLANKKPGNFPLATESDVYDVEYIRPPDENLESKGMLSLISQTKGRKPISTEVDGSRSPVRGYFRSPFEHRIAIVCASPKYILEHEFHWEFVVLGAHLETGFK